MLKLTTDRHEASRSLFATAELLVPCGSRRSIGVPSETGDFLGLLVGELGTPNLPKFSLMHGKWLYPYIMLLHGASDLDQRCLKRRNSENECTFPSNIFAPTPKNHPKTPFWGTFQCESYYTERLPSVAR